MKTPLPWWSLYFGVVEVWQEQIINQRKRNTGHLGVNGYYNKILIIEQVKMI